MSGFARPSRWSISTSTAIAWPLKGRSVCGGRKTASTDQINRQGYRIPSGFRLDFDRNRRKSQRFLDRYKISLLCRASLEIARIEPEIPNALQELNTSYGTWLQKTTDGHWRVSALISGFGDGNLSKPVRKRVHLTVVN